MEVEGKEMKLKNASKCVKTVMKEKSGKVIKRTTSNCKILPSTPFLYLITSGSKKNSNKIDRSGKYKTISSFPLSLFRVANKNLDRIKLIG